MKGGSPIDSSHRDFVDALRECLGLEPLYRESDSSSFYLQERSVADAMSSGSANAVGMIPRRSVSHR